MIDALAVVLVLGFAAAGVVFLARKLAATFPSLGGLLRWDRHGAPLDCATCMSGWAALALVLLYSDSPSLIAMFITWLAATGVSTFLVSMAQPSVMLPGDD